MLECTLDSPLPLCNKLKLNFSKLAQMALTMPVNSVKCKRSITVLRMLIIMAHQH